MQSSTARLFIHIVLLASFASALCACGTKGPLYISLNGSTRKPPPNKLKI